MPDSEMPPLNLTLIVAATQNLGIGARGALPWRLRAEMQYFARVTTRLPPQRTGVGSVVQNAVIMGRKTWESIPPKFRPLKDRLNVVLSSKAGDGMEMVDGALWVTSLEEALDVLKKLHVDAQQPDQPKELPSVARAFVIGGAGVYKSALELPGGIANRVLLTRVYGQFECDTFFPDALETGWRRRGNKELSEYVGEEVAEGTIKEKDIEFEYCLFERENAGD